MSVNISSQRITDRLAVVRGMNERGSTRRRGFWPLALLWLPVGVVTTTAFHFMLEMTPSEMFGMWVADGVGGSALAGPRRPLRPATGAGMPTVVVARISPCRLERGRDAGDRNGVGVATAGIAQPAGVRCRRGSAQPAGMDRGAMAGPARLALSK